MWNSVRSASHTDRVLKSGNYQLIVNKQDMQHEIIPERILGIHLFISQTSKPQDYLVHRVKSCSQQLFVLKLLESV